MNWFKRIISPSYKEYAERKWQDAEAEHRAASIRWGATAYAAKVAGDPEHAAYCEKQGANECELARAAERRALECRNGVDVSAPGDDVAW